LAAAASQASDARAASTETNTRSSQIETSDCEPLHRNLEIRVGLLGFLRFSNRKPPGLVFPKTP
jgi:hypothetical protein